MGENDLCFGYRPHHFACGGVCCCGLVWEDHMPPHDSLGRLIPQSIIDRDIRRKGKRLEARLRRMRDADCIRATLEDRAKALMRSVWIYRRDS